MPWFNLDFYRIGSRLVSPSTERAVIMKGTYSANNSLIGISRLQHRARQLRSQQHITENQSLNLAAHEHGFSDYQAYLSEVRRQAIMLMLEQSGRSAPSHSIAG